MPMAMVLSTLWTTVQILLEHRLKTKPDALMVTETAGQMLVMISLMKELSGLILMEMDSEITLVE